MSSFFFNPWMLAALAAVAIPPIIEWLFRRRKRQVELPTLRYLLNNKEQEKIRRQDLILLLLRCLGIGVLAFAVARPLIQRGWISRGAHRNVVVVLDGTASMQQAVKNRTAFYLARSRAAGIIRGLPAGTTVTAIYLGERAEQRIGPTDKELLNAAASVDGWQASSGAGTMDQAIKLVNEVVNGKEGKGGTGAAEVYLLSNFQKNTWQPKVEPAQVGQGLKDISKDCEVFMVDVGGEPEYNFMLTGLKPETTVVSAALPVKFGVTVESWGKVPPGKHANVTFLVNGTKVATQETTPGERPIKLSFDYRFPKAGEYLIEAEIDGDTYDVDNQRQYLCSVPEAVAVLILDEQAGLDLADSRNLANVICPPTRPGMDRVSHFATRTVPPAQLIDENLDDYAAVAMMASPKITPSMVSKLENYVRDGGALWLFMGSAANPYDYNTLLFKGGQGLLPCKLAGRTAASQPADLENGVPPRLGGDTHHGALAELSSRGLVEDAGVYQYYTVSNLPETPNARVVNLKNGDPLLVEKKFGRGTVLLCTTTAGYDWGYLSTVPEFGMLVQGLIKYVVGDPDKGVNLEIGQAFKQPVFVSLQPPQIRCPDGRREKSKVDKLPDREDAWEVSFDKTDQHGLFEVVRGAQESQLPRQRFVVNMPAGGGNLERLTDKDAKELFSASRWTWVEPQEQIEEMAAKLHTVIELAAPLLIALLAVLASESFLAWRFGRRLGE